MNELNRRHPMFSYNCITAFVIAWMCGMVALAAYQAWLYTHNPEPTPVEFKSLISDGTSADWLDLGGWVVTEKTVMKITGSRDNDAEYAALRASAEDTGPLRLLVDVTAIEGNPEYRALYQRGVIRGTLRKLSSDHRHLIESQALLDRNTGWKLDPQCKVIVAGDRPGTLWTLLLIPLVIFMIWVGIRQLQVIPRRNLRNKAAAATSQAGAPTAEAPKLPPHVPYRTIDQQ